MNPRDKKIEYVAEISGNHLGSISRAKELIKAAAASGATAVKFQTYTADTMTLDLETFKVSSGHKLWGDKKLYDLYKEAHTPWEWHSELFDLCRNLNMIPFSSPFDFSAVDFLESLNVSMYKIASLETGDHALINQVAKTGKPIMISTGATTWQEIEDLVAVVKKTGNKNLTLLLCTSSYPADPVDAHLNRLKLLEKHFACSVGLSDHTLGIGVSIAAIALGATVIEKHLTLNRADGGPDSAFSLEPYEFKALVEEGNKAFVSIGNSEWQITESEKESRRLRRSLYIVKNVKKGDLISLDNLKAIRPGAGCSPKYLSNLLGKHFAQDFALGTPMEPTFALEIK
jgi:N-acetylneuraminate synthase